MKNHIIFALIIFSILFIVPSASLSYFEKAFGPRGEVNAEVQTNEPVKKENEDAIIKSSNVDVEPDLIKVYNTDTNEVMVIDFEEYLKGVVASEMPAEFNLEALKAQAVTARTYLLYRIKKYPDGQPEHLDAPICTGIHCQAWTSKDDLIANHDEGWYEQYWGKIEESVNSTKGQILTYEGKVIEPLFHSTSGGRTENSEDVFVSAVPYLRSVESPYEGEAPKLHDSSKINVYDFISKIKSVYGNLDITPSNLKDKIVLGELSEGGKIKTLIIDNQEISGREIRSLFNLNSTNFSFIQTGNEIEIITTGYGHGVGMSQWGADGMADEGYNYKEILKHYYTDVEIVSVK
ncbi:MAG: stage II sporulation protein D [Tissierellia bacterium]|nr:stage II sporulation protein D [Tissierellia bacterium]